MCYEKLYGAGHDFAYILKGLGYLSTYIGNPIDNFFCKVSREENKYEIKVTA